MRPSIYEQIIHNHPDSYTAQIITLDAHCSNLQARLLVTLDALDDLQRNHRVELNELNRRIDLFRARSTALKARTKLAEMERDTLREGVNELIAKVEFANDYRALPHSRIYLSYPLEPCTATLECKPHPDLTPGSREAMLNALVSSLTNQLSAAENMFADLKKTSEAKIATLEAKVARRDAEIEMYRPCPCSCHPHGQVSVSSLPRRKRNHPLSLRAAVPFTQEASLQILEETATRQRELQADVDVLTHKLSAVQLAKSDTSPHQSSDIISNHNVISNSSSTSNLIKPPPVLSMAVIDRQPEQEAHNLSAERDNTAVFVTSSQGTEPKFQNQAEFRGILLAEEECVRLRKSERALRQQLLLASANEQDLRAQVERMQRQLSSDVVPATYVPKTMVTDGEADMDLEEDMVDPIIEDLTARSTTPDRFSQPTAHQAHTVSDATLSSSRLAHIEYELRLARTEMESKERDIEALRTQVASLKKVIQTTASKDTRVVPITKE